MPRRNWLHVPAVLLGVGVAGVGLSGCGTPDRQQAAPSSPAPAPVGFRSGPCNQVTDAEVRTAVAGALTYTKVVDGEAGCFWQEDTMLGSVGAGMGISTWWYRGSDLDTERRIEQQAGRALTDMEMSGNVGFRASDANACSVYLGRDDDVIAWSVQTMNPAQLPDLCGIVEQLAQRSQDRVN